MSQILFSLPGNRPGDFLLPHMILFPPRAAEDYLFGDGAEFGGVGCGDVAVGGFGAEWFAEEYQVVDAGLKV